MPAIAIIAALIFAFLLPVYKKISKATQLAYSDSTNNSAFLLLHQGFIQEASQILEDTIRKGEDITFAFSNFAICKAKDGEFEQADSLIRAAKFYAGSSQHENAVINFNESLIYLIKNHPRILKNIAITA